MTQETDLTPEQREFHLVEFNKLNGEIAELIKSTSQFFNFAVFSAAAVFAWVLTAGGAKEGYACPAQSLKLGLWVPLILCAGLAGLASANAKRIAAMGEYLHKVEKRLGHRDLGWEQHFKYVQPDVGRANRRAWLMLLAGCAFTALTGSLMRC